MQHPNEFRLDLRCRIAEHYAAANDENNQQTAEEILLSILDGLADDKLIGFALRLVLTGHTPIPYESEIDFLAEAAFAPPQPKATAKKKEKKPTVIKAPSPKNTAAKKKDAA